MKAKKSIEMLSCLLWGSFGCNPATANPMAIIYAGQFS